MDNMGSGGGNSERAPFSSVPENAMPMGEVASFEEFVKQNENLRPQIEMPAELTESMNASAAENVSEKQSQSMPVAAPAITTEEDAQAVEARVKNELSTVDIKRDAEVLPKAYMQAVDRIINRNKKDPRKMLEELDVARWDMMSKAFGRNRGDGLNGRI